MFVAIDGVSISNTWIHDNAPHDEVYAILGYTFDFSPHVKKPPGGAFRDNYLLL